MQTSAARSNTAANHDVTDVKTSARMRGLTQVLRQVAAAEKLDMLGAVEEVLVDGFAAEQPDVAVVGDRAVRLLRSLQARALSFRFAGRHHERHAEQPQQLLQRPSSHDHTT